MNIIANRAKIETAGMVGGDGIMAVYTDADLKRLEWLSNRPFRLSLFYYQAGRSSNRFRFG
jgi:hypothetical protein